jgi:hypothetical protein
VKDLQVRLYKFVHWYATRPAQCADIKKKSLNEYDLTPGRRANLGGSSKKLELGPERGRKFHGKEHDIHLWSRHRCGLYCTAWF